MDHQKTCFEVIGLVKEVASFIRNEKNNFSEQNDVEVKGHSNFVTYVDKASEKMLVDNLSKLISEAGFIAEEGTSTKKGEEFNWIIDPLDGTTNFIHGLSPHSISVALKQGDEIVIGVVLEIVHEELFYAWRGSKAYRNGKEITVAKGINHDEALVATGFPYYNFERKEQFMQVFNFMIDHTRGVRRLGSAAIDLCYVACGRFDGFWEYALHAWDVAAGALIVQQAGGVVSDFSKGDNYLFSGEIMATSSNYYNNFSEIVNRFMK